MGCAQHFLDVVKEGGADAVAMADILHYDRVALSEIRNVGLNNRLKVRHYE